jgi:hypothetical protein
MNILNPMSAMSLYNFQTMFCGTSRLVRLNIFAMRKTEGIILLSLIDQRVLCSKAPYWFKDESCAVMRLLWHPGRLMGWAVLRPVPEDLPELLHWQKRQTHRNTHP